MKSQLPYSFSPEGSPGMESDTSMPYETLQIEADGTHRVFFHH